MSNLFDDLAEGIHKDKSKYKHDHEKCETCLIRYKDCKSCLEYTSVKDDLIRYKCLCCNKNYQKRFNENLKRRFSNTYKFYNDDNDKFILFLWKVVYPYGYMDDWEKFNETSSPEKEDF